LNAWYVTRLPKSDTSQGEAIFEIERALQSSKKEEERENKVRAGYEKKKAEAQELLDQPVEDVQAQVAEAQEGKVSCSAWVGSTDTADRCRKGLR
jgi:uncharacterized protein with von Willebrand factor type A (vWA) domain